MLAKELLKVSKTKVGKCFFCFGEVNIYKNAAQIEEDVFYFLHTAKILKREMRKLLYLHPVEGKSSTTYSFKNSFAGCKVCKQGL